MAQSGEIDLSGIKGKYNVNDIELVDKREIDFANEFRLTAEISFALGLTLLGVVITNFNGLLSLTTAVFILFGLFNMCRYKKKYKEIKK
jgi:hypothetical protein